MVRGFFNPFTPKISLVILLTVCDTILQEINVGKSVLDQLIIPWLIFFSILITCLLDIVLILQWENLFWSLMRAKELMVLMIFLPDFTCLKIFLSFCWNWYVGYFCCCCFVFLCLVFCFVLFCFVFCWFFLCFVFVVVFVCFCFCFSYDQ